MRNSSIAVRIGSSRRGRNRRKTARAIQLSIRQVWGIAASAQARACRRNVSRALRSLHQRPIAAAIASVTTSSWAAFVEISRMKLATSATRTRSPSGQTMTV